MLSREEIFDLAEPFGAFEYGDAQGDKRIAFARAVERAAYERAAALCGSPYSDETDDPYECGFNRAAEVIADAIRALGEQHD